MARYENPPFPLGTTLTGGDGDLNVNAHLEGLEWEFNDDDFSQQQGVAAAITYTVRRMRVMRNVSGGALLPKRIAKLHDAATSAKQFLGQTNGYAADMTDKGYPIDEFLPAAGVANNDLFWVCIRGRAKVTTAASGDTNIPLGNYVLPSTDGKVVEQNRTELDADLYDQIQNRVGRALEAVNATDTDLNVWVDH